MNSCCLDGILSLLLMTFSPLLWMKFSPKLWMKFSHNFGRNSPSILDEILSITIYEFSQLGWENSSDIVNKSFLLL